MSIKAPGLAAARTEEAKNRYVEPYERDEQARRAVPFSLL